MPGRRRRGQWTSLAAPAVFLLGVTIAVLLVRSALNEPKSEGPPRETRPAATAPSTTGASTTARPRPRPRFATVRAGDTFSTVAARAGITVAELERLNPRVKSTSLFIGQKLRVR
jgi:LysM repeat protein